MIVWLLVLYLADGTQIHYRESFASRAACEIAAAVTDARHRTLRALQPDPDAVPPLALVACIETQGQP